MAEEGRCARRRREQDVKARKERERDELYALDISGVEWQ